MKRWLIAIVLFYQRRLSPRKNYECAHRRLHGGHSCSGYFLLCLEGKSVGRSAGLLFGRLLSCRSACRVLRSSAIPGAALGCGWCLLPLVPF